MLEGRKRREFIDKQERRRRARQKEEERVEAEMKWGFRDGVFVSNGTVVSRI